MKNVHVVIGDCLVVVVAAAAESLFVDLYIQ